MSNDQTTNDQQQPDIKSLREAAANGKAAIDELAKMRKDMLFMRAGVDINDPTVPRAAKLLYGQWEGEDLDALKADLTELGVGAPVAPAAAAVNETDQQVQQFREGMQRGNAPAAVVPESPNPYDAAYAKFYQDLNKGVPRERAALDAFDVVFAAGTNGDQRVIYDPEAYAQEAAKHSQAGQIL